MPDPMSTVSGHKGQLLTAGDVADLILSYSFQIAGEADLQHAIADILTGAGLSPRREVTLSRADRIDLLVDLPPALGIEVKVKGQAVEVERQLARYAASPKVGHLMLVSTRIRHVAYLPEHIGGKPVTGVLIGRP